MKTNNKTQQTVLSLALLASLSATAFFVASAEEKQPTSAASFDATVAAAPAIARPGTVATSPVIELPPTTTVGSSTP